MSLIKLMIADDQALFREGMITVIETLKGIKVIGEAENGKELLEKISKRKPDVVLLDLKMPVMDGSETLVHIKKEYPDIKVVILTMYDDEDFVVELVGKGANGYLLKNTSSVEEVENTIRQVMKTDYYYSDYVQKIIATRMISRRRPRRKTDAKIPFTEQELEILRLICKEFSNEQIGEKVNLSARTIEGYKKRLQERVGAKSVVGLVVYAIRNGLV